MGAIIKLFVYVAIVVALLLLSKPISTSAVDHDEISNSNNGILRRNVIQTTNRHEVGNGYQYSVKDEDTNQDGHKQSAKKAHCLNKKSLANRSGTMLFGVGPLVK
uniref:Uncharacterized protein n=1 Tax=Cucumis sativus TaxID=3659 RepID=A0A0A0K5W7_CUCSA